VTADLPVDAIGCSCTTALEGTIAAPRFEARYRDAPPTAVERLAEELTGFADIAPSNYIEGSLDVLSPAKGLGFRSAVVVILPAREGRREAFEFA
jgi:hypothetical protein